MNYILITIMVHVRLFQFFVDLLTVTISFNRDVISIEIHLFSDMKYFRNRVEKNRKSYINPRSFFAQLFLIFILNLTYI